MARVIIFGWNLAKIEFLNITVFQIQLHYDKRTIYLINELVQRHISLILLFAQITTRPAYSVGFQTQLMRQKNVQFTQNSGL